MMKKKKWILEVMQRALIFVFSVTLSWEILEGRAAPSPPMGTPVSIPGGEFQPLYGFGKNTSQVSYTIQPFRLDPYPVTRREFLDFLRKAPNWNVDQVKPVFVDPQYLRTSLKNVKDKEGEAPVTEVSWYAATAFCKAKGGRLPSVLEWEFVAAASEKKKDASKDPEFVERILKWYGERDSIEKLGSVYRGIPNIYGVYHLHGMVWEWTDDFNSVFVTGDNRQDGDKDGGRVCGAGATDASTRSDYAAFMRYAMRSSVQANYSLPQLGFRCAYSDSKTKEEP